MSKRHKLNMVLNSIQESDDPTILPVTFTILDFDKSRNNVVVEREVALQGASTLINKPIVTAYKPPTEAGTPTDNLGSHEQVLAEDRDGDLTVVTKTTPIGVFTSEGYLTQININGEMKEVLACDGVIWKARFQDATELLLEWYREGVNINTSCEYLFNNYSVRDGVEYHESPIYFDGHAILASEDRGGQREVIPAYESSKLLSFNQLNKFNKLVAQAIEQEKNKEDEPMSEEKVETAEEVLETEVTEEIKEAPVEETEVVEEKVEETANEEVAPEEEVVEETVAGKELAEDDDKFKTLEKEFNELKLKFEQATDKVVELTTQVNELSEVKKAYDKEVFEKSLNEKKEYYGAKFKALNAEEKFNEEEVQELIAKSISDSDASLQLNSMLVDMVTMSIDENEKPLTREVASKREDLLPEDTSFVSRYGA